MTDLKRDFAQGALQKILKNKTRQLPVGVTTLNVDLIDKSYDQFNSGVLLTIHDVMRIFSITSQTVYTWRIKKRMPYIQFPGETKPAVRYDLGALMEWAKDYDKPYRVDAVEGLRSLEGELYSDRQKEKI